MRFLSPTSFDNLNISTVHRARLQLRSSLEFHVTGTGSLFTGCRDLFETSAAAKMISPLETFIVFNEYDLDFSFKSRIIVNDTATELISLMISFAVNIAGGCLSAENEGSRIEVHFGCSFSMFLRYTNVHDIERLALYSWSL